MIKSIIRINIRIIIDKILAASVIRWINVYNINLPGMCLFQQPQTMEVIAFQQKVVGFAGCRANFPLRHLGEHGDIIPHLYVNRFLVPLPHKAVFLLVQRALDFTDGNQYIVIIFMFLADGLEKFQHPLAFLLG